MDKTCRTGRRRAAMAMARAAKSARARLVHDELTGRYRLRVDDCAPFMLPRSAPATDGERAALGLQLPPRPQPGPGDRP